MGVKYVKDFEFSYMNKDSKVPKAAKASSKDVPARAKPNAPARGAPKMESKPKVGKGQGFAEGGRVPGYDMDRLPAKKPPGRTMDLAPSKPEKGKYQGYAMGGMMRRERERLAPRARRAVALPMPVRPLPEYEPVYKKGGEVKGKSKIGKVMGEYKAGKLHSGSKKGPVVKSEKQAMAIALSEARKAGAKIPKKAEGGIFSNEYMAYESKGPKTRYTAAKGRRMARERAMERRALDKARHAEKYAPGMSLDMPDRKKHGGMPVHRRKPMYGGGKC